MKQTIIITTISAMVFMSSVSLDAQIAGISASKLNAITVSPIDKGAMELEPTFSSSRSTAIWDEDGLNKTGNTDVSSSICWRVTHAISDDFEIGLSIPSDFSTGSLGMKTVLSSEESFSLGAMAGFTAPFGNRSFDSDSRTVDDLTTYGIGFIGSWTLSAVASIDATIQYQDYFNSIGAESAGSMMYNMDYGHYIADGRLLLIFGIGYQTASADGFSANVFSIFPGIAIETSDKYALTLNTQHDLLGKNALKTTGINLAVTTLW